MRVCVRIDQAVKSERFRFRLNYSATRLWLLYIYLIINKYITFRALVIWAEKILKKSEKVVKLGCFGLYNILGG